eukprot:680946_1
MIKYASCNIAFTFADSLPLAPSGALHVLFDRLVSCGVSFGGLARYVRWLLPFGNSSSFVYTFTIQRHASFHKTAIHTTNLSLNPNEAVEISDCRVIVIDPQKMTFDLEREEEE